MIHLELFSGIGGFSKGLLTAGYSFDKVYYSEIDKHAIANFKYNYPNATYIGSVTDIHRTDIERPNLITFGSPCQNFSPIGDGKGLMGRESRLISQAIEAVRRFKPDVFIWENVKESSSQNIAQIFGKSSKLLPTLGVIDSNGNCLIRHGFYPRTENAYTLSDVLQKDVPQAYFLSCRKGASITRGGIAHFIPVHYSAQ